MIAISAKQVKVGSSRAADIHQYGLVEFAGFLANPAAMKRGGPATQAARGQQCRGLLDRMAQVEVNRFWRAEISVRDQQIPG